MPPPPDIQQMASPIRDLFKRLAGQSKCSTLGNICRMAMAASRMPGDSLFSNSLSSARTAGASLSFVNTAVILRVRAPLDGIVRRISSYWAASCRSSAFAALSMVSLRTSNSPERGGRDSSCSTSRIARKSPLTYSANRHATGKLRSSQAWIVPRGI